MKILGKIKVLYKEYTVEETAKENHGGRDRTEKHQRKCPVLKRSSMN